MAGRRPFHPTENEKRIAARLREARAARGLTQAQLARILGTTDRTLSRYETLERPMPLPLLLRMQEHLGPLLPGVTGAGVEDGSTQAAGEQLAAEEAKLVEMFRALVREKKDVLLGRAVSLLQDEHKG